MTDQVINMTMHTLNKYGIPCTDVTEYVNLPSAPSASEGSPAVFYLQKSKYNYLIKTKLKSSVPDIPIPEPFEPITGIQGFNYCVFHNEPDSSFGSTGYIDYYSLASGTLVKTVALPYMVGGAFPMAVDINSSVVVYDPVHTENEGECYGKFTRNADGSLTEVGKVHLNVPLKYNDVTLAGTTGSYIGYHVNYLMYDKASLRPSLNYNNRIHSNVFGEDKQIGRFYEEAFPDLSEDQTSPEVYNKRVALRYDDLFVGDLSPDSDYVLQVPFSDIMDTPDLNFSFIVNIFNDQVNDGSGKYIIGSGQIQGIYYGSSLFILLTFDDIRGSSGNQAYQKWYNSSGSFLYEWIWPEDEDGNLYSLTGRITHQNSFFYVIYDTNLNSYLLHYNLISGSMIKTELNNPYKDTALEGPYKISNLQLIDNKYLMVHTSSGHIIFFDAYNPSQGIKGEISMASNFGQLANPGYYVVPQVGDDQPLSSVTNKLLQLCNSIRSLKMTWAANQVQVCQDHANWCVSNRVMQHEGPGGNSVGDRNHAVGIYAGVSENLIIVNTTTDDIEQTDAFNGWCGSPHHYQGIIRGGNKYMSFAYATYPESVTEIFLPAGFWNGTEYTTESEIREVQEWERGKLKIYVQNFIWY